MSTLLKTQRHVRPDKGTSTGLPEKALEHWGSQREVVQAVSSQRPLWMACPPDWIVAPPTREISSSPQLAEIAGRIIRLGSQLIRDDEIEDGAENAYQDQLDRFVASRGHEAVKAIANTLPSQSPELQGYALRYLSQLIHPITRQARLSLILNNLSSPHPGVRYEAAMAVATMRAKYSHRDVEVALGREPLPNLRRTMIAVLNELKS